jgi:hypothetical protein
LNVNDVDEEDDEELEEEDVAVNVTCASIPGADGAIEKLWSSTTISAWWLA